uniref:Uncharacterized protein n=1 Tax=Aegilops tauschii subsp. strangulata TaxID=200361 RepID=A0A452YKL9_AEGTS
MVTLDSNLKAYLPLSWRCLRTTTTKFWCIRAHIVSQALSQATQARPRLKSGHRAGVAAATYVSSKKGATLEEHNDKSKSTPTAVAHEPTKGQDHWRRWTQRRMLGMPIIRHWGAIPPLMPQYTQLSLPPPHAMI